MSIWSKDFTMMFLERYRSYECVWRVKSKDYHNRELKEAAYRDLAQMIQMVDPAASKDTVIKKINNLRSSFRKEFKKVKRAQKSGVVYVPKLWYFNELLFLLDQEQEDENSNLEDTEDFDDLSTEEAGEENCSEPSNSQLLNNDVEELSRTSASTSVVLRNPLKRPSSQSLTMGEYLRAARGRGGDHVHDHDHDHDHLHLFGRVISQKLRLLSNDQRIFAEKLINDTLFEAELGTLSRNSRVHTGL